MARVSRPWMGCGHTSTKATCPRGMNARTVPIKPTVLAISSATGTGGTAALPKI